MDLPRLVCCTLRGAGKVHAAWRGPVPRLVTPNDYVCMNGRVADEKLQRVIRYQWNGRRQTRNICLMKKYTCILLDREGHERRSCNSERRRSTLWPHSVRRLSLRATYERKPRQTDDVGSET